MANRSAQFELSSVIETAHLLDEIREELARVRTSIDQLRDHLGIVLGHSQQPPSRRPTLRLTSLPMHPTRPDFFQRIKAVSPEQLDAMRTELVRSGRRREEDDPISGDAQV